VANSVLSSDTILPWRKNYTKPRLKDQETEYLEWATRSRFINRVYPDVVAAIHKELNRRRSRG